MYMFYLQLIRVVWLKILYGRCLRSGFFFFLNYLNVIYIKICTYVIAECVEN